MDRRERLRELLSATEMKQVQLARALGVMPMTVSRWLTERADALDPPDYAFSFLLAYKALDLRQRRVLMNEIAPRPVKPASEPRTRRAKPSLTVVS